MSMPMRVNSFCIPQAPAPLPVTERRSAPARRPRLLRRGLVASASLSVAGLSLIGVSTLLSALRGPELLPLMPTPPQAQLAVAAASLDRHQGYVTVTGSLENRSAASLSNVEVVVELRDARDHTLQMESALVPANPLLEGRSAPFRVELRDDSRAASYRIWFRRLTGQPLE